MAAPISLILKTTVVLAAFASPMVIVGCNKSTSPAESKMTGPDQPPPPPDTLDTVHSETELTPVEPEPERIINVAGQFLSLTSPELGTYKTRIDISGHAFQTREITHSERLVGVIILELIPDEKAFLSCGIHLASETSQSKYVPGQTKDETYESENKRLVGAQGTWSREGSQLRVSFTHVNTTALSIETDHEVAVPFELLCSQLDANDWLPAPALACELVQPWDPLDSLGIELTEEALRPRRFRSDVGSSLGRHVTKGQRFVDEDDLSNPWLILGLDPGLRSRWNRDRRGSKKPSFIVRTVKLDEDEFKWSPD